MATRTATTTWSGGLMDGSGTVEFTSSGAGRFDVSFPQRAADEADGTTSPEELIAAAHSSCFAMQFSALLGESGGTATSMTVRADVSLGPDPAGGLRIPTIHLTVRAAITGADEQAFLAAAEAAKASCPVSKALAGTEITLDAALA
jgi:osmotically inducible protein OsmC